MTDIQAMQKQALSDHAAIFALEDLILQADQVELPVEHEFCNGLYARTMHIPAGVALTGQIHKNECFFVVRFGIIRVTSDDGPKTLYPGAMVVSGAGSKRAGFAITDSVVTTFHLNSENEKSPEKLWDALVVPAPVNVLEAA